MAIVTTRGKPVQVMRGGNTAVYVNHRDNVDALPVCRRSRNRCRNIQR
jgi:hypothetical protein